MIRLGPESLDLLVTAILDQHGTYVGPMLTWEVVTDQLAAKRREAETAMDTNAVNQLLLALGQATSTFEVGAAALGTIREAFGWPYATYFELDPADQPSSSPSTRARPARSSAGRPARGSSAKARASTARPGGPGR